MSSRELLGLLEELPETSTFKESRDRRFRVVEYLGETSPETGLVKGELYLLPAVDKPPNDVEVIAEYVDWTYDRKLSARTVRELVALRAHHESDEADFSNLTEPLDAIIRDREQQKKSLVRDKARKHILGGLYGYREAVKPQDAGLS